MRSLRSFKFVFLFLILAIFLSSSRSSICFCGNTCLHGLRPNATEKVRYLFHMLCPGTLCKSCDLEKGLSLKAVMSTAQVPSIKMLDTTFIPSTHLDYPSIYYNFNVFASLCTSRAIPSSPIFLQSLSIRC